MSNSSTTLKPLLLAIGMMVSLFLTIIIWQMGLASSGLLLLLFISMQLASVVLVFLLVGLIKQNNALQMRSDLINTGRDLLTGLPDPQEFESRVDIECRRCTREFTPLTLMYVGFDVTSLTERDALRVTETLSHAVSRPGDMVAKVDDTTFGMILPSTNEFAQQLADRCLKGIQQLDISTPVSIGLSTFQPTSDLNYTQAMRSVQYLLIKAKAEGGNKICADADKALNPPVTYSY